MTLEASRRCSVDNQHRQIKGYRELTQAEIAFMNSVKVKAEEVNQLIISLEASVEGIDKRWLAIAKTDLQKGFMSLTRSVARPEFF